MLIIIANTVVLALDDPTTSTDSQLTLQTNDLFLTIYTVEACLKICGLGFYFAKSAYIKDNWNRMDFAIVMSAWLSVIFSQGIDLRALRTIRVLRPLRSISNVKGLRQLFMALIYSLKMLLSSVVVIIFFFLIFAIAGLQLYMGILRNRCMDISTGQLLGEQEICGARQCNTGSICVSGLDNPNFGVTNFDDILFSFLAVFQCVTLEGWTSIMISLQKALSPFVVVYFVPLVFIGAFFLLNLTLAVIKNSFTKVMDSFRESAAEEEDIQLAQIDQKLKEDDEAASFIDPAKLDSQRSEQSDDSLKPDDTLIAPVLDVKPVLRPQAALAPLAVPLGHDESWISLSESKFSHSPKSPSNKRRSVLRSEFSLNSAPSEAPKTLFMLESDQIPSQNSFKISSLAPSRKSSVFPELGLFLEPDLSISLSQNEAIRIEPEESIVHRSRTLNDNTRSMSYKTDAPETNNFKTFFKSMTFASNGDTSNVSFKRFRNSVRINTTLIKRLAEEQASNIIVKCVVSELHKTASNSAVDIASESKGFLSAKLRLNLDSCEMNKEIDHVKDFREKASRFSISEAYGSIKYVVRDTILKPDAYKVTEGKWSGDAVIETAQIDNDLMDSLTTRDYALWSDGLIGVFQKCLQPLHYLVTSNSFNHLMTLCVILNTFVLAMDHYDISSSMSQALTTLNLTFTIIFSGEMVLKVLGLGIQVYFKDSLNWFDFVVVILSIIEIFLISGNSAMSALRTIRIFRTFRVLRVARIFRYLRSMSMILRVIGRTISQFIYLAMLLLLLTLIFALIGMQIFGGKFDFEEGKPRANFDSFFAAFLSVFQVMTVENWHVVMYNGIRAVGPAASIYFVSWVFLGNFVLLNLFLAILLDSFNQEVNNDTENLNTSLETSLTGNTTQRKLRRRKEEALRLMDENADESNASSEIGRQGSLKDNQLFEGVDCVKSYFLLSKENPLRVFCYRVTSSQKFEWFILSFIVLNAVKLVWDTYLLDKPSDSINVRLSDGFDIVFTVVFGLEFLMKSISMGFNGDRGSYLSESWNKLDFFIVVISIIEMSLTSVNLSTLRVLRLLRTLRALRFISHYSSMKLVVIALLESVAAIFNVAIVVLIVWLIFAILGMSLFSGKLHYCSDEHMKTRADCEDYGHKWLNYNNNFDNTFEAIKTLFIVSSLEDWPTTMYRAMDTTEVDHATELNSNPTAAIYFLVFVLLGSYFFMNLFIGVVFEKFQLAKRSESSLSMLFMKKEQIFWVEMQQLVLTSKPQIVAKYRPTDSFRMFFFKVSKSKAFELGIIVCIVLNILQMAIAYYEASDAYTSTLENINLAFTAVFIVEASIKIIGYGITGYFHQRWNQFDFFVVGTSIMDLSMTYFGSSTIKFLRIGPQLARVIRVLRVSKLIRIVKSLKSLQELLQILKYSLPAVFNILSLLLLIYFIYAILGVYLFSSVKSGVVIDEYTNFSNFGMAVITLLRASTGEDWPTIMYDCMVTEEATTTLYFLSFTLVTNFIMLNMFIMVILQQWEILANNPQNVVHIFNIDANCFKAVWSKHSAKFNGVKAEFNTLNKIMLELGPDLGVDPSEDNSKVQKFVYALRLPLKDGCVYYNDLLFALLKRKHRPKIEKAQERLRYVLMDREENSTLKMLAKLRDKMNMKLSYQNFVRSMQSSAISKDSNMFFAMLNVRKVFNSWRVYTEGRRNGYFRNSSVLNSLDEYPGRNTPDLEDTSMDALQKSLKTEISWAPAKPKVFDAPESFDDWDNKWFS